MGSGRWDASDWASVSSTTSTMSRSAIFRSSSAKDEMLPKNITFRESVDSAANPNSTPLIIGCDVTGSMGVLAETIVKKGLGVIMEEVYDKKPIPDPHLMCMAIGDAYCDRSPLQVTQFEAEVNPLTTQVMDLWLEGGGGGNNGESYHLPWYFAAFKVKADAILKRKRKGYLFTIGDEGPVDPLTKAQIKEFFGDDTQADMYNKDLLSIVCQNWEVYHLIVKPVGYQNEVPRWRELLGERAIIMKSHDALAEVIVSTIRLNEGHDYNNVVSSWSGDTSLVVADALKGLTATGSGPKTGVVRL